MIRINLLAPELATKKKTAGGPALPSGGALQSYLFLVLFAGVKLWVSAFVPIGSEESSVGRGGPGGFLRLKFSF